jgi:hypothetical protein
MKPKKKTSKANSIPDLKGKEMKADKAEAVKGGGSGGDRPQESLSVRGILAKKK